MTIKYTVLGRVRTLEFWGSDDFSFEPRETVLSLLTQFPDGRGGTPDPEGTGGTPDLPTPVVTLNPPFKGLALCGGLPGRNRLGASVVRSGRRVKFWSRDRLVFSVDLNLTGKRKEKTEKQNPTDWKEDRTGRKGFLSLRSRHSQP